METKCRTQVILYGDCVVRPPAAAIRSTRRIT